MDDPKAQPLHPDDTKPGVSISPPPPPTTCPRSALRLAIAIAIITTLLPLAGYWLFIGRAPAASPAQARADLAAPGSTAVLVDVREPDEFEAQYLKTAVNWPRSRLEAAARLEDVPPELRDRRLYLICASGLESAVAALRLRTLGLEAVSVRGGMAEWGGAVGGACPLQLAKLVLADGREQGPPYRESSRFEQWFISIVAFGVKPLYMLLSLAIIVWLWRARPLDLAALRWAMILFLAGEVCCAANYLFFTDDSNLLEYLHGAGMALAFGLAAFSMLEAIDQRLLHYQDPHKPCAALALCGPCVKLRPQAPCGARRLAWLAILVALALSIAPLSAQPYSVSYNTEILGVVYQYMHPELDQLYEIRVAPSLAIALFLLALVALAVEPRHPVRLARLFFSAGLGFLGFSLLRLFLFAAFRDHLMWFQAWEELTELIFVISAGATLWIFRRRLFAFLQ